MSQATLTFILPEEAHDHDMAAHAQSLASTLVEFRGWLREKRKHGEVSQEVEAFLGETWFKFHEFLLDNVVERFVL